MIDRRTFIQGAAFVASSSAFAALLPLSTASQAPRARLATQSIEEGTNPSLVLFKIDGWDLDSKAPTGNEVVIRVNQLWRAAWR
jgi:hypothetical protein